MEILKYNLPETFLTHFIDYMEEDENGESGHSKDYYAGKISDINNYLLGINTVVRRKKSIEDFCNSKIPPDSMSNIFNVIMP